MNSLIQIKKNKILIRHLRAEDANDNYLNMINNANKYILSKDKIKNLFHLRKYIFLNNYSINQLRQMQHQVRNSIPILSEYCLYFSAKWAAELLVSIDSQIDFQMTQSQSTQTMAASNENIIDENNNNNNNNDFSQIHH